MATSSEGTANQLRMAFPGESADKARNPDSRKKSRGGGSGDDHPGVGILCAIPGIDRTRALAILEHFGSVRAFDQGTLKERMRVAGIGRTLAKRFDYCMELPLGEQGTPSRKEKRAL